MPSSDDETPEELFWPSVWFGEPTTKSVKLVLSSSEDIFASLKPEKR
jgi:hypothetical protein